MIIDEQDKRIAKILGVEISEDSDIKVLFVTEEAHEKYLQHLKDNIESPCLLKGIEDFKWEEYYVFGPGDEKEYERLKKTRPSYTDIFKLLRFEDEIDSDYGIMVRVKRVSDRKQFTLPLAELEAPDKKSKNYQLFKDYSVWFVNF